MKTVHLTTKQRNEFIDITDRIQTCITQERVKDGVCYVFVPHTTAGITINENADPSVVSDILTTLEKKIPASGSYRHAEGNSDAHIKASLMGFSVTLFIHDARLALGTWQGVYFAEFDGPRSRSVWVQTRAAKV